MSEGSVDAAILIAVSFQALNRALRSNLDTLLTDCTVVILFAGFYVEATLNHIFESTGKDIKAFPTKENSTKGKKHPGLWHKLAFFHNEFIDDPKAASWNQINQLRMYANLERVFPGFSEPLAFRNDLSHGKINKSANSLNDALRLRQQAKDIVGKLYKIAENNGCDVPRLVTYEEAIASLRGSRPTLTSTSSS